MKKLILSVAAVTSFSVGALAQGAINFDGSSNTSTSPTATTSGLVFINGVLDTSTDINAELLYSSTATGAFSPVVTLLLSNISGSTSTAVGQTLTAAGDITDYLTGQLYDGNGISYNIPGFTGGSTAYFQVQGWLGNYSSLASAQAAGKPTGTTAVFSETLVAPSSPTPALINNMPALNLTAVPEPSTLAMAGVGLASMLIFRRRNK
jgi:hypothetical protein